MLLIIHSPILDTVSLLWGSALVVSMSQIRRALFEWLQHNMGLMELEGLEGVMPGSVKPF